MSKYRKWYPWIPIIGIVLVFTDNVEDMNEYTTYFGSPIIFVGSAVVQAIICSLLFYFVFIL